MLTSEWAQYRTNCLSVVNEMNEQLVYLYLYFQSSLNYSSVKVNDIGCTVFSFTKPHWSFFDSYKDDSSKSDKTDRSRENNGIRLGKSACF